MEDNGWVVNEFRELELGKANQTVDPIGQSIMIDWLITKSG